MVQGPVHLPVLPCLQNCSRSEIRRPWQEDSEQKEKIGASKARIDVQQVESVAAGASWYDGEFGILHGYILRISFEESRFGSSFGGLTQILKHLLTYLVIYYFAHSFIHAFIHDRIQ